MVCLCTCVTFDFFHLVSYSFLCAGLLPPWGGFSSVQSLSRFWLFVTPWIAARQASMSITSSGVYQTHVHWVGDAIQPSHPLSSLCPPALNLSQHQGLSQWVSTSHWVAKVFSFNISPSSEHSGLISFRMDWLDLLAVQGTLKRVFSNTTVQKHQFFGAQLSL